MKRFVLAYVSAIVITATGSLAAHHSTAMYDHTARKTLAGTVVEFGWVNPHSYIQVDVPNESGGTDRWAVAMGTPSSLVKAGWKSTVLKPGDRVTVTFHPLKDGSAGGSFLEVKTPDGNTYYYHG